MLTLPPPAPGGIQAEDWGAHQVDTTVDFSRDSAFLTWFLGGLNFQVDGRDYRFVSREEFDRMIADDQLLEWADIHGGLQRSGTPAQPVEERLAAGEPVLVEVDLTGARNIVARLPEATTVFLAPPSWDVLVERLTGRGTETPEAVERRLATARTEMDAVDEFEHVLVNSEVDQVADRLVSLLVGSRQPHQSQENA